MRSTWPLIRLSCAQIHLWSESASSRPKWPLIRPKWPLLRPKSGHRSDFCALKPLSRPRNFGLGAHGCAFDGSDHSSIWVWTSAWVTKILSKTLFKNYHYVAIHHWSKKIFFRWWFAYGDYNSVWLSPNWFASQTFFQISFQSKKCYDKARQWTLQARLQVWTDVYKRWLNLLELEQNFVLQSERIGERAFEIWFLSLASFELLGVNINI